MFVSFTLTIGVMFYLDRHQPRPAEVVAPAPVANAAASDRAGRPGSGRLVYPYSIVPGGVRSQQEVARAMRIDPVVADHYARVEPANLREQQIQAPQLVHASYRIGDKIFWTKRRLVLHPGERVLTDGSTMIRERCGNLLTIEPLAPAIPALEDEPAPAEFDAPMNPFTTAGAMPYVTGAGDPFGMRGAPFGIQPPVGGGFPVTAGKPGVTGDPDPHGPPIFPPPPPPVRYPVDDPNGPDDPKDPKDPTVTPQAIPPVPVPEPGTFVLVGIGAAAGLIRYARSRRAS